jgi:hypothetical protein
MAAAIKRTTLKLGMIPADGIGKEVIPVSTPPIIQLGVLRETILIDRPHSESLRRLDPLCPGLSSSRSWLVGRSSTRMERLFLMRLSGRSLLWYPRGSRVKTVCVPVKQAHAARSGLGVMRID